jgi:hypothetical protein
MTEPTHDETPEPTSPEAKKTKPKFKPGHGGGRGKITSLTISQKAEAVAMWREGKSTLADLSKRFKRRPETFSRMFKRMGITKGDDTAKIAAAAARVSAKVEAHALSEVEENLQKLSAVRKSHITMSENLAKIAWHEIVRARQAGIELGRLRDTMQVLKLAGEVIGGSRKELFEILDWEELRKKNELSDLPDLVVRELTQDEVGQLKDAVDEFDAMDEGGDEPPDPSALDEEI